MPADTEIVLTRLVNAPRAHVWRAWTEREHLERWYGPDGFTITTSAFDFREGGAWVFVMHGPDGRDYPNKIVFTQIREPELLAHDHGDDGKGEIEFQATITFTEQDGGTLVTLRNVFPTAALLRRVVEENGAIEGGKQTLAKLAAYAESL